MWVHYTFSAKTDGIWRERITIGYFSQIIDCCQWDRNSKWDKNTSLTSLFQAKQGQKITKRQEGEIAHG